MQDNEITCFTWFRMFMLIGVIYMYCIIHRAYIPHTLAHENILLLAIVYVLHDCKSCLCKDYSSYHSNIHTSNTMYLLDKTCYILYQEYITRGGMDIGK